MNCDEMIKDIEKTRDIVIKNFQILEKFDKNDHYWKEILELASKEYFFETSMVIYWVGYKFRPKKILEIGTRTGGSLLSLLSPYKSFDDLEIYCFDLWKEYCDTTIFPSIIAKYLPFRVKERLAIKKVKKNLHKFNISSNNIKFIPGDSKITIPNFFRQFPEKSFDYILVDGGHDRITASSDLENVVEHISNGGILVFDDIGPESYKLIDVWETFKNRHINDFDFFEKFHRKGVAWAIKK